MKYRLRPHVIMERIDNEYYLLACEEARQVCPWILPINIPAALYWGLLEDDLEEDELLKEAASRFHVSIERVQPGFQKFVGQLCRLGYIVGD